MLDIKTYTLKQVSEILSVTERTLFKYLKSGKLRGQKIAVNGISQRKTSRSLLMAKHDPKQGYAVSQLLQTTISGS